MRTSIESPAGSVTSSGGPSGRVHKRHVERVAEVGSAHPDRLPAAAGGAAGAALAEEIGEDVGEAAEIVLLRARPASPAGLFGVFAVEAPLRPLRPGRVDLSAVETGALLGIPEQVVGGAGRLEPRL